MIVQAAIDDTLIGGGRVRSVVDHELSLRLKCCRSWKVYEVHYTPFSTETGSDFKRVHQHEYAEFRCFQIARSARTLKSASIVEDCLRLIGKV